MDHLINFLKILGHLKKLINSLIRHSNDNLFFLVMPYEEIFWILFIFEFFLFFIFFLFLDFFIFQKSHVIPYPTVYLECLPNSIHSFFVSISWKSWKCPNFSINWNHFLICWKCQFFVIALHNLLISKNWIQLNE